MINPGVITLSTKKISGTRCVIEDNIGECIHFHMGNIRLDLSIIEFSEITNILIEAVKDLIGDFSKELFEYDSIFLNYISEHLLDLKEIKDDFIDLESIVVFTRVSKREFGWSYLPKSIMVKALNGDCPDYYSFEQNNRPFQTNRDRLTSASNYVKQSSNIGQIVLLNSGGIILDGQHRCSCLYNSCGNLKIPIKRFVFNTFDITYKIHSPFIFFVKKPFKFLKRIAKRIF